VNRVSKIVQVQFILVIVNLRAETTAVWTMNGRARNRFNTNDSSTGNMAHNTEIAAD